MIPTSLRQEHEGPFLIAEIAQGYEGDAKLVELFVKAAAAAGADAVKFQVLFADESALPDYQHYELYKRLELPPVIWQRAIAKAHDLGIRFFIDALGVRSMAMLEPFGVDGYKIHTGSITNPHILRAVAKAKKPVLLSTGGNTLEEIDRALAALAGCPVTLMVGFQAEPTAVEDNHIARMRTLADRYQLPIGFQDHTAGDDPVASLLPFLALGAGATLIEKHLTLSRLAEMEDCVSAFTAEEFSAWAAQVRVAAKALGQSTWELTDKERQYKLKARKALVLNREMHAGDVFREEDLDFKRTRHPGAMFDITAAAGKQAARALPANTAITESDIV